MEESLEVIYNNPSDNIKEDVELPFLYSYLDSRLELKRKGYALEPQDSSAYFKLRHNCFKSLVMFSFGRSSTVELPFSRFGINSNRTPDYLEDHGDFFLLMEFTVSNRFQTSLENKQYMTKYNPEVAELSLKKPVFAYYLIMSLDKDIDSLVSLLKTISKTADLPIYGNIGVELTNLQSEFRYINWHINSLAPELLVNVDIDFNSPLSDQVEAVELFKVIERIDPIKSYRDEFILRRMWMQAKHFLSLARSLNPRLTYTLQYNVNSNSGYFLVTDPGFNKGQILSFIEMRSKTILQHTKVLNAYTEDLDPFSKFEKLTFVDNKPRSQRRSYYVESNEYANRLKRALHINKRTGLLSSYPLDEIAPLVRGIYEEGLSEIRSHSSNKVIREKNCFIFPITDKLEIGSFNTKFYSRLKITNLLLSKIKEVKRFEYSLVRDIDIAKFEETTSQLSTFNKVFSKYKNFNKKIMSSSKFPAEIIDDLGIDYIEKYIDIKKAHYSSLGELSRTHYKNRITVSNSAMKESWSKELDHFRKDSKLIEIYPEVDINILHLKFKRLCDFLYTETTNPVSENIFGITKPTGDKLKGICNQMKAQLESTGFVNLNVSHSLQLIKRFCYSLLYFSNIKLNKTDFCFDNLGYKNVILLVKGGKKINSTRKSRLFKLIYPINDLICDTLFSDSNEIITISNVKYCVTPWRILKFDILKKGTELLQTFGNFYSSGVLESGLKTQDYKRFMYVKTLMMFSQKRKLEVWFGNFRYIYFNSLGTHTKLTELIKSMVDHDYEPLMYLFQRLFAKNYIHVKDNAQKGLLYDIFSEESFDNFDLCAEKFDECLFMTKAPFDNTNEHMRNLRSVLTLHKEFLDKYKTIDCQELLKKTAVEVGPNYSEELFEDDLKFDPKLCYLIGENCAKSIQNFSTKEELGMHFNHLLGRSYTDISTSKGMRSSKGQFWGKKGYDVIFEAKEDFQKSLEEFLSKDYTSSEYDKFLNTNHITFFEKIITSDKLDIEFDMKDKVQWKNSREIYVMSDSTKLIQNPLEMFFKKLCSFQANELINKPSHIRPKIIHSKVYENLEDEQQTTYCTLDCRKWAPKSNLWKYYYFVEGLSSILPEHFMVYFKSVWKKMFSKKVRIQARYKDFLQGNESTKELAEILEAREDGDYEITMPYSFMMGIFNYLSSLFHAASQNFFNEVIAEPAGVTFRLLAHSDDSGGTITSKSYEKNLKFFDFYEIFQKGCNHLLSLKKSSLSKISFEIISIMYKDKRLIPMTHKFISNISFEPKGRGWYSDICAVISKVTEIFSNGGSYLQCYSAMLSMCELIRGYYHLTRSELSSMVPIPMGGTFNMHPIHLLFLGSNCQELMLDLLESPERRSFRRKMYSLVSDTYVPGKATDLIYRIPYVKSHPEKMKDIDKESRELLSYLSLYKKSYTFSQYVAYKVGLENQGFLYALTDVDMSKIFLYTLFSKMEVLRSDDVKYSSTLRRLNEAYISGTLLAECQEFKDLPYSNFMSYIRAAESINIDLEDFTVNSNKTCKPQTYTNFQDLGFNIKFETIQEIIGCLKSPKFLKLHDNPQKINYLTDYLCKSLSLSREELSNSLIRYTKSDLEKTKSAYLYIPHGVNIDTLERFWTFTILYCTRRYKISRKKPQFFTMEKFQNWRFDFSSLKHYYLIMRIIKMNDIDDKLLDMLKENSKCSKCEDCGFTDMIDEYLSLKNMYNYDSKDTSLPFITYQTPQKFGQTVWYGSSEFTLYTVFGHVKLYFREGELMLDFYINQEEMLDQIWYLFTVACQTRGISIPKPSLSYNYGDYPIIGFDSVESPMILMPGSCEVCLINSKVFYTEESRHTISKKQGKLIYNDENCDFEIYQNYDVNQSFFQEHNLDSLQRYIMTKELRADVNFVRDNFLKTKINKVLMLDESQMISGSLFKKYGNEGFLGADCSFTKALFCADNLGITRYRSSANPDYIDTDLLEGYSAFDIPVLDMVARLNFSRVTYAEKKALVKIASFEDLTPHETENMRKMIDKLGLTTSGLTMVLQREALQSLNPGALTRLNKTILVSLAFNLIKAIHECMSAKPFKSKQYAYNGPSKSFWSTFKLLLVTEDVSSAATLLLKGYLRANSDNAKKMWDYKKTDPILALMNFSTRTLSNSVSFIEVLMKSVWKDERLWEDIDNLSGIVKARVDIDQFMEIIEENEENEAEELTSYQMQDMSLENFFLLEEEGIDYILDISDLEQDCFEWEFREFNGEEDLVYYIFSNSDRMYIQEKTLFTDFKSVTIYDTVEQTKIPWLGKCSLTTEVIDKVEFLVSRYPGPSHPKRSILSFVPKTFDQDLNDLLMSVKTLEQGQAVEQKSEYLKLYVELERLGIKEPGNYIDIFRKDLSTFDNMFELAMVNIESMAGLALKKRSRKAFNALPGFTGVLKDPTLSAELRALFGDNFYQIISGTASMTKATFKMYQRTFNELYFKVEEGYKNVILFYLSVLKDVEIKDSSDAWLVDSLNSFIETVYSKMETVEEHRVVSLQVSTFEEESLEYEEIDPFD